MCNAETNTPVKELKSFEVTLVKFDNPEHKKVIQIKAENAIKASTYAEEQNSGFFAKSSDLI